MIAEIEGPGDTQVAMFGRCLRYIHRQTFFLCMHLYVKQNIQDRNLVIANPIGSPDLCGYTIRRANIHLREHFQILAPIL